MSDLDNFEIREVINEDRPLSPYVLQADEKASENWDCTQTLLREIAQAF